MTEKSKNKGKKWDFSVGLKDVPKEKADAEVEAFLSAIEERFKDVPEAEIRRGAEKMKEFALGNVSWAELFNFTPEMLFHMAEFGFTQFKVGRYSEAERVFKVLTVLDWNNSYYHSVMGSILQRQKRYGEAIAEYSQALDLDPNDVVSLTNRGEVFMQHGLMDEAETDFKKAIELDPERDNKFANRSRIMLDQIIAQKKKGKKEKHAAKGKSGK